jgi:uncharacterized radical SAM superfamily Fe-S cluster-containing enzyme
LLDVTERCNQRCPWCFARAGDAAPDDDPPLSVIDAWYDRLLELGEERPFNIQLSGGEPTIRDDLPRIVRLGREKGFDYIQLNTNGRRIAEEDGYAQILKESGASVVFLQFDGLRDEIYRALRGENLLDLKLRAIENCRRARLAVTLVPTLVRHVNLDGVGDMIRFMLARLDVVKGIHFQPASFFGRRPEAAASGGHMGGERAGAGEGRASQAGRDYENRVTMFETMREIERQTGGLFSQKDLLPIATGHPLCCFSGSFLKERDGSVLSLMSKEQRALGADCCCGEPDPLEIIRKDRDFVLNKWDLPADMTETADTANATDTTDMTGAADTADTAGAANTTDAADMASAPDMTSPVEAAPRAPSAVSRNAPMDFDDFLRFVTQNRFTLTGMAFQDLNNLDAERLKRCRVQVFSKEQRLIPFCAYNSIYRR